MASQKQEKPSSSGIFESVDDDGDADAELEDDVNDEAKSKAKAKASCRAKAKAASPGTPGFAGECGSSESRAGFHDYLAPFLAQFPASKPLSRKQALQVKEECLRALKERLLERANIIQAHLDSENELLRQRQSAHDRTVAALSAATQSGGQHSVTNVASLATENEEFSKFFEETMFRISILQARLGRVRLLHVLDEQNLTMVAMSFQCSTKSFRCKSTHNWTPSYGQTPGCGLLTRIEWQRRAQKRRPHRFNKCDNKNTTPVCAVV